MRADIIQGAISGLIGIIGFQERFQPVIRFIGFFQSDLLLCSGIGLPVRILGFVDIGADTGPGTADLV